MKSGTSGYQNDTEWTNDALSTYLDILTILCNNYEKNGNITDLLNKEGLIVSIDITPSDTGFFPYTIPEEDHFRTFPLMIKGEDRNYPVHKINTNEVAMTETSPIRGASEAKNIYKYFVVNGGFQLLPRSSYAVVFTYCILPEMPVLELVSDDNDYQIVGPGTKDIKLPMNLFNLFCYKMVERAGLEMKSEVALQYSQLGISNEQI